LFYEVIHNATDEPASIYEYRLDQEESETAPGEYLLSPPLAYVRENYPLFKRWIYAIRERLAVAGICKPPLYNSETPTPINPLDPKSPQLRKGSSRCAPPIKARIESTLEKVIRKIKSLKRPPFERYFITHCSHRRNEYNVRIVHDIIKHKKWFPQLTASDIDLLNKVTQPVYAKQLPDLQPGHYMIVPRLYPPEKITNLNVAYSIVFNDKDFLRLVAEPMKKSLWTYVASPFIPREKIIIDYLHCSTCSKKIKVSGNTYYTSYIPPEGILYLEYNKQKKSDEWCSCLCQECELKKPFCCCELNTTTLRKHGIIWRHKIKISS
jgi:hypothetical protein